MAWYRATGGSGGGIKYEEVVIDTLTNGTIDDSRGGCYYRQFGRVVHLHLSVKGLTPETNTAVYTMPSDLRPGHNTAIGLGIGAARSDLASVSVGGSTGTCNLWSQSATALVDLVYIV